jgi:hypothetical protein
MPQVNFIFPPRDIVVPASIPLGFRLGLFAIDPMTTPARYGFDLFEAPAGWLPIYARVRKLRLHGSLTSTSTGGGAVFNESIDSIFDPVEAPNEPGSAGATITQETRIPFTCGWQCAGSGADPTSTHGNLFNAVYMPPPPWNGSSMWGMGASYISISMTSGIGGYEVCTLTSIATADDCTITIQLPETETGHGWDGSDATTFTMRMAHGAPSIGTGNPDRILTGSLTLEPPPTGGYWAHDDGNGPRYDVDTGAYLRGKPTAWG